MKPVEVRSRLIEALELDIVGPRSGSPYEAEVLPQAPSRWYLTGFLVPYEVKVEERQDEAGHQQLELSDGSGAAAADDTPEPPSARRVGALPAGDKTWIAVQEARAASLTGDRAAVARELLKQARFACGRIEAGIDALSDPDV